MKTLVRSSSAARIASFASIAIILSSGLRLFDLASAAASPDSLEVTLTTESPDPGGLSRRATEFDEILSNLDDRQSALDLRQMEISRQSAELSDLQDRVRSAMADMEASRRELEDMLSFASTAAAADVQKLVQVFEVMKAKAAADIFGEMPASLAAGFLSEMQPEKAAGIFANLSPDKAFSLAAELSSRNLVDRR